MDFVTGETYTRDEIHNALGGEKVTYLPQQDNRIVCGCFIPTEDKNPNAPEEVLVGTGSQVESKARLLCRQGGTIPVFLKRAPNEWQYTGEYRVRECSDDPALVRKKQTEARRSNLTMVIYLSKES